MKTYEPSQSVPITYNANDSCDILDLSILPPEIGDCMAPSAVYIGPIPLHYTYTFEFLQRGTMTFFCLLKFL